MKRFRGAPLVVMAALIVLFVSVKTYAFHEGGGDEYCLGCHTMHISPSNQEADASPQEVALRGSDPSSTCLYCHAEKNVLHAVLSTDGSKFTPGGDFYWLSKTFSWTDRGSRYRSEGDSHGHNVVALDYGLHQDGRHATSPGGIYAAGSMACSSCHDPHATTTGNGGTLATSLEMSSSSEADSEETAAASYRLLGGVGYESGRQGSGVTFTQAPPIAVADSFSWTETDSTHPAYGSGMSEWCTNCHSAFLNDSTGGTTGKHPAGGGAHIRSDIAGNYNSYVRTGDLSGSKASSYLALVPFEVGTTDTAPLDPYSSEGPDQGRANVMCLTCHRAHASAFRSIGRWDFKTTFIADSHPRLGDEGAGANDVFNSYYGRNMIAEFGDKQRQLCNKCHLKD